MTDFELKSPFPRPFPASVLPFARAAFIEVGPLFSMSMMTVPSRLPTVFPIELLPFVEPTIVTSFCGTGIALII